VCECVRACVRDCARLPGVLFLWLHSSATASSSLNLKTEYLAAIAVPLLYLPTTPTTAILMSIADEVSRWVTSPQEMPICETGGTGPTYPRRRTYPPTPTPTVHLPYHVTPTRCHLWCDVRVQGRSRPSPGMTAPTSCPTALSTRAATPEDKGAGLPMMARRVRSGYNCSWMV